MRRDCSRTRCVPPCACDSRMCPKTIRPVLETAAVLGRRFDFDTLLDVTREPEAQLLDAVEALVKRRLLREEPEGGVYDFSHDKLREVVYRDIGGARRRLLHQSVAEALERLGEDATHERDAQLAEHYERAHVWSKALHYLVLAGEHSQSVVRDARCLALAGSRGRAVRVAPGVAGRAATPRDLRAAWCGARAGRADARRRRRYSPRH